MKLTQKCKYAILKEITKDKYYTKEKEFFMRKIGSIIAWVLVAVLLCGQMPIQAFAQKGQLMQTVSDGDTAIDGTMDVVDMVDDTASGGNAVGGDALQAGIGNDISMQGETSFGTMLANELSTEMLEQKENNGCNIFSVEMQGEAAIVSFESVQDAFLVIGIYDETGTELLTSGSLEIFAGETTAVVDFEPDSIPQYFYIKGYLVEAMTYRPLCTVYESPMYTQEMQEFLAKTTADFDVERVLNLDEDETNNFAVFGEETILISGDNGQNDVAMADEINNVYVIEEADSSVISLQPGDIFAYPYQENDVLIVKVANIVVDGTTVTIIGADTSMEEVFEYIKIDAEMGSGEATVDASSCGDGVTYEGLVDYVDEGTPQTYGFEAGGSLEKAFKMKLDKKFGSIDGINVSISGGLEMKLKFSAKVYLSFSTQYVEVKLDYSAKVSANVTGNANAEIPLVTVGFMFTGIIVELTPSVVIESKATISLEGTLSGTVGFRAEAGSGISNFTTYPQFKSLVKVEGSIFFGLSLCPRVKILSDKVASAGLTAKVGAEVKASYKHSSEQDEKKKHTCTVCIAGEIDGKFNISANVKFLNSIELTIKPVDWSIKIFDFYYSADKDIFDWTTCPYYLLKAKVIVLDVNSQPLQNVTIMTNKMNEDLVTNEEGMAEIWLPEGRQRLGIKKEGFGTITRELTMKNGEESLLVILEAGNADSGGSEEGGEIIPEKKIGKVSLGSAHSANVTEDGDLYMWGANTYGQLGDGTTTNSSIPKKIMSGVKEVSLGYWHSAAITEEGDLYMWGANTHGELGDGTTTYSSIPKKIMSGVKEVSLGGNHSAAITEEGCLYLWGDNNYGVLGDETNTDSSIPKKIMSGVKEISLGYLHSAAITEEGDLYLWGYNYYGQLGDGTTTYSSIPKKIMSGVKEVSLGHMHSAAITEEGDLYLWGDNDYGVLGDGTNTDSSIPKKIMSGVKEVSLGSKHSATITESGDLYLWGYNYYGQLGNGISTPVFVPGIPQKIMIRVKKVSLGSEHSAVIAEDGDVYLWGCNDYGQLGDETTIDSSIPKRIYIPFATATITESTQVSLGRGHSATITEVGDLYLWGGDWEGQLGDGTTTFESRIPKKIMRGVKAVSLGRVHSAAIKENGDLFLWGSNEYRQSGGTTTESSIPKKIMRGVQKVSLGWDHSAAITETGDLYLWGNNEYGQLGGATHSSLPEKIMSGVKAVSLGWRHSAAITETGDLYLWGNNVIGQLGDGTTTYSNIPKKIMSGVKAVSLGGFHSAAITETGDLYLWGANESGQLGDETTTYSSIPKKIMSGVKVVSLGKSHSAAITETGDLYLWGANESGQLGDGTTTYSNIPKKIMSGVKAVSLGGDHSAAITETGDLYLWGANEFGQLGDGGNMNSSIPIKINTPPITEMTTEISFFSTYTVNEIYLASAQQSNWNGTCFTNLIPNETYNYYVMLNKDAAQLFSTDNLLYIGQAVSDESGKLNVAFSLEDASAEYDIFAVPMHRIDLSDAEISVEDLTYNGTEQYANVLVTYQDTLLVEGVDYNVFGDYGVTQTGDYTLTIEGIGLYTGTISASYKVLSDGEYNSIAGNVTCFGDEIVSTTLQLLDSNGTVTAEISVTGNTTEYVLEEVLEGTYTLQVSKNNHVTREYTVEVTSEEVELDVAIWLKGDVNGDGDVTVKDKKVIFNHMEGTAILTDYAFAVGDVDGNGDIVAKDKKMIYNHIEGNSLLW